MPTTSAPHLPLNLSHSPLLASNDAIPPSSSEEDNELLSAVLAKRLAMPLRMPLRESSPTEAKSADAPLACQQLPSFPSFTTSYASCTSLDASLSPSSSSRSISFMSAGSDSSAILASKSFSTLPKTTGPISTKEIVSLLDLLEKIDNDVEKEVLRVKQTIEEAKLLVREFKSEMLSMSIARESCPTRKQAKQGR